MAQLIDHDGVVRFDGEALVPTDTIIPFSETPGASTYTAQLALPPATALEWILALSTAAWDVTPLLTGGDSADPAAFFDSLDVNRTAGYIAWQWPRATLGTEAGGKLNQDPHGTPASRELYTLYPDGDTLTFVINSAVTSDMTGETLVIVHHHVTEPGPTPVIT